MEKGTRIGAVLSATDKQVEFIGYGTYEGEEVPDEECVGMGPMLRAIGMPNAKIKLDSGETVYGCECWWSEEEELKQYIERRQSEGHTIINITVSEFRTRAKQKEV